MPPIAVNLSPLQDRPRPGVSLHRQIPAAEVVRRRHPASHQQGSEDACCVSALSASLTYHISGPFLLRRQIRAAAVVRRRHPASDKEGSEDEEEGSSNACQLR